MPNFKITFSQQANFNQIAAIETALKNKGATKVKQKDGYFTAELNWSTKQKDLNNLMGSLNSSNGVNGAVKAVAVFEDSSSGSDSDSGSE